MNGLLLYDSPTSSNALKIRLALAEMRLPYERRTIGMRRPRPARFVALNPFGGIPTLRDGDHVVSESHTILRYLAARAGRDDLYPVTLRERSLVDEFLDRFATRFRPALFRHERVALGYTEKSGFDAVPRDPEGALRVAEEIAPTLRLLDGLVGTEGAVLGRFTIADCALGAILFRTTVTGLDLEPYPTLLQLRARILARPSWRLAAPVL